MLTVLSIKNYNGTIMSLFLLMKIKYLVEMRLHKSCNKSQNFMIGYINRQMNMKRFKWSRHCPIQFVCFNSSAGSTLLVSNQ
jgi:hypothetical protein